MPAIHLTPAQRKEKRADAHHLDPVVLIGGDGLTPAVMKETDAALNAHGLIKVRVFSDERETRDGEKTSRTPFHRIQLRSPILVSGNILSHAARGGYSAVATHNATLRARRLRSPMPPSRYQRWK